MTFTLNQTAFHAGDSIYYNGQPVTILEVLKDYNPHFGDAVRLSNNVITCGSCLSTLRTIEENK
jgi:hypothetical protein